MERLAERAILTLLAIGLAAAAGAWDPVPVEDDPLVRMPGTQPDTGVLFTSSEACLECHEGYNHAVEPGANWQGSMMAQAARDPLFFAAMTVALQDSIWAVGTPNAGDLCVRCHFPRGWLEGRSDPTNAALMTGEDFDGVQCTTCHQMYDPFFKETHAGVREGDDWAGYWDESNLSATPSMIAAHTTYQDDQAQAEQLSFFNANPFFVNDEPVTPFYTEAGGGQFFITREDTMRGPFADATAAHGFRYSRFDKSRYFCEGCHDVSNPVNQNESQAATLPGDGTTVLGSEDYAAFAYAHVERTFSEFALSAYGQQAGAPGVGPFAPQAFATSHPGNAVATCQDCHMRDVVGRASHKAEALIRPDESVEHPNSGQPLHDLTGGNAWIPAILASAVVGSPNYDATNAALLGQGAAVLTLDLTQGIGMNAGALLAGADRALHNLRIAADLQQLDYDPATGELSLRILNQTGHKLISGYPEGRRMFLNLKAYAGAELIWEVNPYDASFGTLKGLQFDYLPGPGPVLGPTEELVDELVYEVKPSSTRTGEDHTFHFALATDRYKDNRIPPKGFRIAQASSRLIQPRWAGADAVGLFTAAEYAGGYDDVTLTLPTGADRVEAALYYQTTSREYVEFLRNEINATPSRTTLSSPTPSGEAEAYVIQSDPFFARLAAWGDTMWQLWDHNKDLPGAAPVLMASAAWRAAGCSLPAPTAFWAVPGATSATLHWSDRHSSDPAVTGYRLWISTGAGFGELGEVGLTTSYTHTGLTIGQEVCYRISATGGPPCESEYSNVVCTIPHAEAAPLFGDVNRDAQLTREDILALVAAIFGEVNPGADPDLDNDAAVDARDLGTEVNVLGPVLGP